MRRKSWNDQVREVARWEGGGSGGWGMTWRGVIGCRSGWWAIGGQG